VNCAARAHRDLERDSHRVAKIRRVNLGDRPVIGVVLGAAGPDGIEIVGVSPDGPAERAGLLAGDVLVSIGGQSLAAEDHQDRSARKALFRVMDEAAAGETLDVVVKRGDQAEEYQITAERREPSSWQSMLRIPGAPGAPGMPGAPQVLVEEIEIPPIDDAQLNEDLRTISLSTPSWPNKPCARRTSGLACLMRRAWSWRRSTPDLAPISRPNVAFW
jgi:membrane-associated protease RseP (regulator of RpoE activity)